MNRNTQFFQKHPLNDKKLTPDQVREKLFKDIFGFTRMRGELRGKVVHIIDHVIRHQKTFDYRYYLNKSCPMPSENWKERRAQMVIEGQKDAESRGKVYKELFETGNTKYDKVAEFLTEFVANVFPKDFIGTGKNRKVFTKKVL